ncbi:ATP dependent DNA ligase [Streptomyces dysideae]|uniref:ATP dependent DNA ligase n=1 Tax=Streptomyces dysideae TaxID=909626 RepID=UPI00267F7869|nr:hypothetical protein [Streptomyces dysideae]
MDALADQPCGDFTVDGEIVAFSRGRTDFARLQQRMALTRRRDVEASGVAVTYYVFDLLRLDGRDTTGLPLWARRSLLRRAPAIRSPLRTTPHRNAGGAELLAESCERGWEGLIAKRADRRTLLALRERLDELRTSGSPFDGPVREAGARWVEPELVAQIDFTEWTRDGMLRHPRYLGLRDDKKPTDVARERPSGRAAA